MKYFFNGDNFDQALVALVRAFQKENPGISFACAMDDGTKVSIKAPPVKVSTSARKRARR